MTENTRDIFVLLIRSNTWYSRVIARMTHELYTHASISMSEDCTELFSFARRYRRLPLPAGFVRERIDEGLMGRSHSDPCALYRVTISEEEYDRLRSQLDRMYTYRRRFRYNLIGTWFCFFGLPYSRSNAFFCSQFVADTLHDVGAITLEKPAALYHPSDFSKMSDLTLCYAGTLDGLRRQIGSAREQEQYVSYADC